MREWRSWASLLISGANFLIPDFGLQLFQKVQRLKRRKGVDVGLRQTIEDALRERSEHGELQRGLGLHGDVMPFGTLVLLKHLTGALDNGWRKPGQARDVDSITPVRRTLFYPMQKNDALGGFSDHNMKVF